MKPDEIKKLKELCEKATPGPWNAAGYSLPGTGAHNRVAELSGTVDIYAPNKKTCIDCPSEDDRNAEFIAAAREAIPLLISELEKRDKYCDELQQIMAGALSETVRAKEQVKALEVEICSNASIIKDLQDQVETRTENEIEQLAQLNQAVEVLKEYATLSAQLDNIDKQRIDSNCLCDEGHAARALLKEWGIE